MRNICVRDVPFWDQNYERVKCFECKTVTALPVRGLELRMRIQNVALKIHFPVPNVCASKELKMSSTVIFAENLNFCRFTLVITYVKES